ncbi:MAG: hypothetical protein EHM20_01090 [Alphaproteobacteria bacterium]|nr:MAG: hypothetical protein EHM20_01090 [Alphaproteobacteria bacterium]
MENLVVSIHQPNFLPWSGYFYKIAQSDVFVLLDNVQYSKNSFINRNKIKTPQGKNLWLTVPLKSNGLSEILIKDVVIANQIEWKKKHLHTLEMSYKRASFFNQLYSDIEKVYNESQWVDLCFFNVKLINLIIDKLNLNTQLLIASHLNVEGKSTQLLVNIVRKLNGKVYLSGYGGSKYQEEDLFEKNDIKLQYYNFTHPVYPQLWGEFTSGLSIVDLLFNCGPESKDILMGRSQA